MRIKKIIQQSRRDFTAIYECEHCGHTYNAGGYDDDYFHSEVVKEMECPKCHKKADETFRGLKPKYPEGMQI